MRHEGCMTWTDPGDARANKTWRRVKLGNGGAMDMTIDIFDQAADAERLKAEGMAQAELHATQRWCELAYQAVVLISGTLPEFTSDDVVAALEQSGRDVIESERNLKALGSVMLKAARNGLIIKTGMVRNSTRATLHASPRTIWRKTTVDEFRNRQPSEEAV